MASRFVLPFANVGSGISPSDGAKLEFFESGTSTQKDTFKVEALTPGQENANPVIADGNGVFPAIWLPDGGRYKVTLDDKKLVQKFESDPVVGGVSASLTAKTFDTVAAAIASSELNVGDIVETAGYTTKGDSGNNRYEVVAAATGTDDGFTFIDLATHQAKALFPGGLITAKQSGAVGDGVADDTTEFAAIEAAFTDEPIDFDGATYLVTAFLSGNRYFDGNFKRISDSVIIAGGWEEIFRSGNRAVIIGKDTATNLTTNDHHENDTDGHNLTAIGDGALSLAGNNVKHNTAIGPQTLFNNQFAQFNIAIGLQASFELTGDSGDNDIGSRNVAVGDNAMRFNQDRNNVAIGRNAMQTHVTGSRNVFVGSGAGSGIGPVWIDEETIYNPFPKTADNMVAVGLEAARFANQSKTVAVGEQALFELKTGSGATAIGNQCLRNLENDIGPNGGAITVSAISGIYSQTASTMTITMTAHGLTVGDSVNVQFQTGVPAGSVGRTEYLEVATSADANTWTSTVVDSATRSGDIDMIEFYSGTPATATNANTAVGSDAGNDLVSGSSNTLIGESAAEFLSTGSSNTALGRNALRLLQSAANATAMTNCTGVGFDTRVSGNDQVQLGNSATTTFAFGAVQDRSDRRDKLDISDLTDAHIDFFMDVEWKQFRMNYRENYSEVIDGDDGEETVVYLENDGSKAGTRFHIGAIAQQVEAAMKKHGIDFAGLQYHAINGGEDVYSIGYQEFIGIQGLIIQRHQSRIASIEERLSKAGL